MSGPESEPIAISLSGVKPRPRYATVSTFRDRNGLTIDQGLLISFPGPHSYTGEDVVELQIHGSPVVAQMLVARCLELGARIARPGEFSERAFLSGQLDLAQAEAVADLIESGTETAARSAVRALEGHFSSEVYGLTAELTRLRIHVEAAIDFPEEEIDFLADHQIVEQLDSLYRHFAELRRGMRQGKLLRDGLRVVLSGAPNAGKSSLLNLLCREQRAIVSDIPGTTRDVLEQHLDFDGMPVILVDTAGIRESTDAIEVEGVRRAEAARASADLVLEIIDASLPTATGRLQEENNVSTIRVFNKTDLLTEEPALGVDDIAVSALTGEGISLLVERLQAFAGYRQADGNQFIARQRHIDALDRARKHLDYGIDQLRRYQAGELLAEELRLAQKAMGEITGEVTSDDLLGMIFSSFCIGK